jgi:hypothetical protein
VKAGQRRSLLTHVAALASYLAAATVFTFPLVTRFRSWFPSAPPDQDVFFFLWNNWWIHYAITVLHAKPYFTNYIIAPFQIDLRLGTLGLLYGFLCLPLYSWLGPVVILNLQILGTATLNGYAMFRLTRHVTKSAAAAFLAGLVLVSVHAVEFHLAVGRPSCAALWPLIFTMYFFLRLLEAPDNRHLAFFSVFVVATLAADQQAAMFGVFWLLFLAVRAAVTRPEQLRNRQFLVRIGIAAIVAIPPAYFLYYNSFVRTVGYTVPGEIEAYGLSYPVSLLWSPSLIWEVYGVALPAALMMGIGLALARRAPAVVFWVLVSMFFVVLSFGPVVSGTRIPLPFMLLRKLPTMAQFRAPYRFQIPAAIGLCVALGVVVAHLMEGLGQGRGRRLFAGALALVIGDLIIQRAVSGFPMQTMTHEPLYETIHRDPRDILILEVPVGVRTGTDRIGPGEALGFHQPIHQKRLINGSTSRLPLAALEYYRSSPIIMFLAGETPPPGDLAPDLQRRLKDLKVGYVIVHPAMLEPNRLKGIVDLLDAAPNLVRMEATPGLIAFRVSP